MGLRIFIMRTSILSATTRFSLICAGVPYRVWPIRNWEKSERLGRKALKQVACGAKPDTIRGWYRRLIAAKFDGSKCRTYPGRPPLGRGHRAGCSDGEGEPKLGLQPDRRSHGRISLPPTWQSSPAPTSLRRK